MAYEVEIVSTALEELKAIKPFHRRQIADAIDAHLPFEPSVETRNRKRMVGAKPGFEHLPPIWELRVGSFRVLYDIDESVSLVTVRSIREKPPHLQTEDIL